MLRGRGRRLRILFLLHRIPVRRFNAEQVMYNHFGYRTPLPNFYYAGSGAHPGGAISGGPAYIVAGILALGSDDAESGAG